MRFEVYSFSGIHHVDFQVPHVIISIADKREDRAEPATNDFTKDILFLEFHDIDVPKPGFELFTTQQAEKILDFFERYRNEVDLVAAHCIMGQSRSPGVIAALQRIQEGNDDVWFRTKTPNRHVYSTLLFLAHERGLFDPFEGRE